MDSRLPSGPDAPCRGVSRNAASPQASPKHPLPFVDRFSAPRRIMRAFIVEEQKVLKQVLVEKTRTKKAAAKGGKRR